MPTPALARLQAYGGIYFAAQAAAVAAWWILLAIHPGARRWFLPAAEPEWTLLAFLPADPALIATSIAASIRYARRRPDPAWTAAGCAIYATLACIGTASLTGGAWLNVALMLPCAAASLVSRGSPRWAANPQDPRFFDWRRRPLRPGTSQKHWRSMAVFWTTFLWILPLLIGAVERELEITRVEVAGQGTASVVPFAAASALGLWSAITMDWKGAGTPLPVDAPRRLVVAGPYCSVRNPMAVAGLAQGLAVALGTGSWLTALYSIAGGVAWNLLARPLEEESLVATFGESYETYRRNVRYWWPTFAAGRTHASPPGS
jgi:protein-S-isoprenylcysteine O-methyltransferase Ste14